jgi:fatty acid desaturase
VSLAGYACVAGVSLWAQSWAALLLWLGPMLAMKGVHQLQNTIEHLGLPHQDNVLVNTRSTRTNALMRWLGWQMQYHTAHHAFPGVPFHRLRELHEAIFTSRSSAPPSMTYLGFQMAVLRAFARGKTESDYSDDRAWLADPPHG